MSDAWHYGDVTGGTVGPVSLEQLRLELSKQQDPRAAFVWCPKFTDWMRAGDVAELKAILPPPLPKLLSPSSPHPVRATDAHRTWRVPWWWYVAGVLCMFGFSSVGNRVGRTEMGRASALRSEARQAKKQLKPQPQQQELSVVQTTETKKASTFWLIVSILVSPVLWVLDATAMSNFWVTRTPLKKWPPDKSSRK